MTFVVVAKAPIGRVTTFAEERGWRRLRLLSSSDNTYNRDYHAESATGEQRPFLNVFQRVGSTIRHFWGSELFDEPTEPDQDPRHVGTLEPSWNLLDLTPEGRPTIWDEQFTSPEEVATATSASATRSTGIASGPAWTGPPETRFMGGALG
jgi:predicted dithiol-disulfide oxidoreductase (DUF899 family)